MRLKDGKSCLRKSNGAMEHIIKRLQGQIRTIKMFLGHALCEKVDMSPDMWHWFVDRAADTLNRCKVGEDAVPRTKG